MKVSYFKALFIDYYIDTFLTRCNLDSGLGLKRHSNLPSSVVLAFRTRRIDLILLCLTYLQEYCRRNRFILITFHFNY